MYYREPASLQTLSISDAASASIAVPPTTELDAIAYEICCDTADFHFRFGASGESALATDPICKAGILYREVSRGQTHLHCLAVSGYGSGHTVEATPVAAYPVRLP